jgi:Ran GTPase-activating protein (RanGAP) involved in mRNA processing and transport
LEILNISGNLLGLDGIKSFIKGLRGNTTLRELSLVNCEVTEHGCDYVCDALPDSELIFLDLSCNPIGNKVAFKILTLGN